MREEVSELGRGRDGGREEEGMEGGGRESEEKER